MSANIQDINGSVQSGYFPVARVGFDVPLVIGITGERFLLSIGSGVNGLIIKGILRETIYNIVINVTGSVYAYSVVGSTITFTVPTTHTIRGLIADFAVNGGTANTLVTLTAATTGAGTLSSMASTPTAGIAEYSNIQNISQLQYYYDITDLEYVIVNNMLSGPDTHITNLFLLDVKSTLDIYGVPTQATRDLIKANDLGDWYMPLVGSSSLSVISGINQYISTVKRLMIAVTDTVADLASVQGNIIYVVHPTAQKDSHPEASWAAKALVPVPGSSSWKWVKSLYNQTPNLTSDLTALLNVRTAQGNSYQSQGGISFMNDGLVNNVGASSSNPDYIDSHMLKDWMVLNMQADLLSLELSLVAQGQKLNYDDKGIGQVVSTIANRILIAARSGAIAKVAAGNTSQANASYDGKYRFNVTAPTRASIEANSPTDIVQRILKNVSFWYIQSGAIEKITFSGTELITEPAA